MPIKFSAFPDDLALEAASLGQHNDEVLGGLLGLNESEINALVDDGVLVDRS